MPRGTDTFPPEIWVVVLTHARLPIPSPLSRPRRCRIRQQSLTVLARTCKLFNSICTSLLYKTVVTDDPADLLNIGDYDIPNRRKHLALIENLYIEYQDEDASISYVSLLRLGRSQWANVAPNATEAENLQMRRCGREVRDLLSTLEDLSTGGMGYYLPRLATLAVGSIYGHQNGLWSRYNVYKQTRHNAETGDPDAFDSEVAACLGLWESVLISSNVKHVCVRDVGAPFAFPFIPGKIQLRRPAGPERTIHFAADTPGLGLNWGHNATWVSDATLEGPWAPMYEKVKAVLRGKLQERIDSRITNRSHIFQLDIYGSTNSLGAFNRRDPSTIHTFARAIPGASEQQLSVGVQREIARAVGNCFSQKVWEGDDGADRLRWYASQDYHGCPSCGGGTRG